MVTRWISALAIAAEAAQSGSSGPVVGTGTGRMGVTGAATLSSTSRGLNGKNKRRGLPGGRPFPKFRTSNRKRYGMARSFGRIWSLCVDGEPSSEVGSGGICMGFFGAAPIEGAIVELSGGFGPAYKYRLAGSGRDLDTGPISIAAVLGCIGCPGVEAEEIMDTATEGDGSFGVEGARPFCRHLGQ